MAPRKRKSERIKIREDVSQRLETARAGSNDEQTATREDKRGKDGTLPNTQEERSPLSRFARKTEHVIPELIGTAI